MNEEVANYIAKLESPQKEICIKLRAIILKAIPKVVEEMKYGVPWFEKVYIVGLKDHVNIGFVIEGLSKKDLQYLEGNGKETRHIQVKSLDDIEEKVITRLLKSSFK